MNEITKAFREELKALFAKYNIEMTADHDSSVINFWSSAIWDEDNNMIRDTIDLNVRENWCNANDI